MGLYHVMRRRVWKGVGPRPIPVLVTTAIDIDLANHERDRLDEAEGRSTDGPVEYTHELVEAVR